MLVTRRKSRWFTGLIWYDSILKMARSPLSLSMNTNTISILIPSTLLKLAYVISRGWFTCVHTYTSTIFGYIKHYKTTNANIQNFPHRIQIKEKLTGYSTKVVNCVHSSSWGRVPPEKLVVKNTFRSRNGKQKSK